MKISKNIIFNENELWTEEKEKGAAAQWLVQHINPAVDFTISILYPSATQMHALHRSSVLFFPLSEASLSLTLIHILILLFVIINCAFFSLFYPLPLHSSITILCICFSYQLIALSLHVVGIFILLIQLFPILCIAPLCSYCYEWRVRVCCVSVLHFIKKKQ